MASLKKQLEIESKSGQDLGAGHSVGFEQSNIFEEQSVLVLCVCYEPLLKKNALCLFHVHCSTTFVHFEPSSLITEQNTIQ